MKKLLNLVCFILFFYFTSHGQEMKYDTTVDILPSSGKKEIKNEHDLNVTHDNDKYVIEFNIKHGKKIQTHRASVGSEKLFDKASYKWVSDNKVAVKLYNMNSMDTFELKVWGEKRSTGMEVETDDTSKL